MKNNLKRFFKGVAMGLKLSVLPAPVQTFHTRPLVRIFRVLGGTCSFIFLGKFVEIGPYLEIVILTLALIHLSYIFIINIIKVINIIYLWKNKKLEVRNSPLDRFATLGFKLVACAKGVCVFTGGGAAVGSIAWMSDDVLIDSGRRPIFRPAVREAVEPYLSKLGLKPAGFTAKELDRETTIKGLNSRLVRVNALNTDFDETNKLLDNMDPKDKALIEFSKEFSEGLYKELMKTKSNICKEIEKVTNKPIDFSEVKKGVNALKKD